MGNYVRQLVREMRNILRGYRMFAFGRLEDWGSVWQSPAPGLLGRARIAAALLGVEPVMFTAIRVPNLQAARDIPGAKGPDWARLAGLVAGSGAMVFPDAMVMELRRIPSAPSILVVGVGSFPWLENPEISGHVRKALTEATERRDTILTADLSDTFNDDRVREFVENFHWLVRNAARAILRSWTDQTIFEMITASDSLSYRIFRWVSSNLGADRVMLVPRNTDNLTGEGNLLAAHLLATVIAEEMAFRLCRNREDAAVAAQTLVKDQLEWLSERERVFAWLSRLVRSGATFGYRIG